MSLWARIAREWRFLSGMTRTLWSVREIAPDSDTLMCDDWEAACAKFATDLRLLAHDHLVELIQQVFVEAGFDFQVGEALLSGVLLVHAVLDTTGHGSSAFAHK